MKRRSFPDLGVDPDAAMISLHDSLTDCQPNASAGIFISRVEPLEQTKDALPVLGFDAEAVVADGEQPAFAITPCRYVDHRWRFGSTILYRVTHEVLEKLLKLRRTDAQKG